MLTIAAFIFAILLLVSLHELGHFLVARLFGVKVTRFSIGFGKPFLRKQKGDTEWCLAPIPLGGYVKMIDTREGEVSEADLPYAFDQQHPAKRIAIVLAGPLTNLLLAVFFFFILAFFYGETHVKPVVGTVLSNSMAQRAGFQSEDVILAVNQEPIADFAEAQTALVLALDQGDVVVSVRTASGAQTQRRIERQKELADIHNIATGRASVGLLTEKLTTRLGFVDPKGVAYRAGLRSGDQITAIDGQIIHSWFDMADILQRSPGRLLQLDYQRDNQHFQAAFRPDSVENSKGMLEGRIGVGAEIDQAWSAQNRITTHPNFQAAWLAGLEKTGDYAWLTLKFFGRMLTGQASVAHISGPFTIADMAGKTAAMGLQSYIQFLALISLSLGVLNLLPIPVLDGGHLLYYAVEWIRGKPLSQRIQETGLRFGMVAMLLLMCIAFFNDFTRIFG